jgi:TolA-binding protein
MDEAKQYEASGEWENARQSYQKLEKIKGWQEPALFKQAMMAFQSNDIDGALALSKQAAALPGAYRTQAKFLVADVTFKQGDYERAKSLYIDLRKSVGGDLKATATKKIAFCNQKLKLPDRDGVTD